MEKSQIFYSDKFGEVQETIREFLNSQEDYLSTSTANSPRAVGDAIQDVLGNNLQQVLGEQICKNYSANFARRAMADRFFWTCGETEGVANSFLGKMHPEALLDKDLITHQVCL